jgi:hypothetical protein
MRNERERKREKERERERKREKERERERQREKERDRERKREQERERERERERCRICPELLFLFLKGMTGALAPFTFLVAHIFELQIISERDHIDLRLRFQLPPKSSVKSHV